MHNYSRSGHRGILFLAMQWKSKGGSFPGMMSWRVVNIGHVGGVVGKWAVAKDRGRSVEAAGRAVPQAARPYAVRATSALDCRPHKVIRETLGRIVGCKRDLRLSQAGLRNFPNREKIADDDGLETRLRARRGPQNHPLFSCASLGASSARAGQVFAMEIAHQKLT